MTQPGRPTTDRRANTRGGCKPDLPTTQPGRPTTDRRADTQGGLQPNQSHDPTRARNHRPTGRYPRRMPTRPPHDPTRARSHRPTGRHPRRTPAGSRSRKTQKGAIRRAAPSVRAGSEGSGPSARSPAMPAKPMAAEAPEREPKTGVDEAVPIEEGPDARRRTPRGTEGPDWRARRAAGAPKPAHNPPGALGSHDAARAAHVTAVKRPPPSIPGPAAWRIGLVNRLANRLGEPAWRAGRSAGRTSGSGRWSARNPAPAGRRTNREGTDRVPAEPRGRVGNRGGPPLGGPVLRTVNVRSKRRRGSRAGAAGPQPVDHRQPTPPGKAPGAPPAGSRHRSRGARATPADLRRSRQEPGPGQRKDQPRRGRTSRSREAWRRARRRTRYR